MILVATANNIGAAAGHLGGGGVEIPVARIVMSLIACLAVAMLAILFLRQRGGKIELRGAFSRLSPRRGEIDVVEVRRLSLHGDICLVRHDGHEYLILVQASDSRILRERPMPVASRLV